LELPGSTKTIRKLEGEKWPKYRKKAGESSKSFPLFCVFWKVFLKLGYSPLVWGTTAYFKKPLTFKKKNLFEEKIKFRFTHLS